MLTNDEKGSQDTKAICFFFCLGATYRTCIFCFVSSKTQQYFQLFCITSYQTNIIANSYLSLELIKELEMHFCFIKKQHRWLFVLKSKVQLSACLELKSLN